MSKIHYVVMPIIAIFTLNTGATSILQSSISMSLISNQSNISIGETKSKPELVKKIDSPSKDDIKEEIVRQAKKYGVSVDSALAIAKCESEFIYNASNKQSTAKGVYQFLDGTWEWTGANGHQYDYQENIRQFMKWYPKVPNWWECHKIIYGNKV
jgi:hypothetical protein